MEEAQFFEMAECSASGSRADALWDFIVLQLLSEMDAPPENFKTFHSRHEITAAAIFRAAA